MSRLFWENSWSVKTGSVEMKVRAEETLWPFINHGEDELQDTQIAVLARVFTLDGVTTLPFYTRVTKSRVQVAALSQI